MTARTVLPLVVLGLLAVSAGRADEHDVPFFGPSLRRAAKFLSEQVVKAMEK